MRDGIMIAGDNMKTAAITISSITAIFVVLTLVYDNKGDVNKKTIFKSLASLCFVVSGAIAYSTNPTDTSTLIFCALVAGLIGDVLLGYRSKNAKIQMALDAGGMLAFIAGHVLFITAFILRTTTFNYALLALVFGLPVVVVILFIAKLLTADKPIMAVGALLYSAVAGTFLASACNLYMSGATAVTKMILAGTVLFAASDLILAFLNYNKTVNRKAVFPFVLVFYYVGQNLIALSMMI